MVKIFAVDTSLFSIVKDPLSCATKEVLNFLGATKLNCDLERILDWANQWKMSFNPDPSKQAVEVYFSRRTVSLTSPPLRLCSHFADSYYSEQNTFRFEVFTRRKNSWTVPKQRVHI